MPAIAPSHSSSRSPREPSALDCRDHDGAWRARHRARGARAGGQLEHRIRPAARLAAPPGLAGPGAPARAVRLRGAHRGVAPHPGRHGQRAALFHRGAHLDRVEPRQVRSRQGLGNRRRRDHVPARRCLWHQCAHRRDRHAGSRRGKRDRGLWCTRHRGRPARLQRRAAAAPAGRVRQRRGAGVGLAGPGGTPEHAAPGEAATAPAPHARGTRCRLWHQRGGVGSVRTGTDRPRTGLAARHDSPVWRGDGYLRCGLSRRARGRDHAGRTGSARRGPRPPAHAAHRFARGTRPGHCEPGALHCGRAAGGRSVPAVA
jgi:hypothetical protein